MKEDGLLVGNRSKPAVLLKKSRCKLKTLEGSSGRSEGRQLDWCFQLNLWLFDDEDAGKEDLIIRKAQVYRAR